MTNRNYLQPQIDIVNKIAESESNNRKAVLSCKILVNILKDGGIQDFPDIDKANETVDSLIDSLDFPENHMNNLDEIKVVLDGIADELRAMEEQGAAFEAALDECALWGAGEWEVYEAEDGVF